MSNMASAKEACKRAKGHGIGIFVFPNKTGIYRQFPIAADSSLPLWLRARGKLLLHLLQIFRFPHWWRTFHSNLLLWPHVVGNYSVRFNTLQVYWCGCVLASVMQSEREKGRKEDDRYRLVVPKHAQTKELLSSAHSKHNRSNAIKTTKYSLWSFLPKNLFEQFHRFANIYFLGIVILNLIPEINAFGKYIAMVPLIFVLSVTAIKDLFEDRRRYKSDKAVNNSICHVFNR